MVLVREDDDDLWPDADQSTRIAIGAVIKDGLALRRTLCGWLDEPGRVTAGQRG